MLAVPLAIVIDAAVGDPPVLWRATGHPVTWFGAVIDRLDRALNRGAARRLRGTAALAAAVALFAVPAAGLAAALDMLPWPVALAVEAALGATLLAHRSLHEHVAAVADAPDLPAARAAVAHVVGRDTDVLDEAGVACAALETLAESFCDGVVAPVFWFALAGLPGLVAFKVVSTADSMIGHRTPRHEAFGWAAARTDDVMNWVPARLAALLLAFTRPATLARWRAIRADAAHHASPNAGWPEATLAAALGVVLGGTRSYDGHVVETPRFNAGGREPRSADIRAGLRLAALAGVLQLAVVTAIALA